MRAIRIHTFGPPDVLTLESAAVPSIGPGDVLVRVRAAGVNPVDAKTRAGRGVGRMDHPMPITLGWDVSGGVEAVGKSVTRFRVGDEVYAMPRFPQYAGAYAEFASVPEADLALKPKSIDHVQAAALPLAVLTAWQGLFDTAMVREGQRVLVQAASGGVGHLAVQLAKAAGAYVIGTASVRNADFLRELGVDEVVDYAGGPVEDAVHDVDIVFDCVGGETQAHALRTLKRGGMLVSILGLPARELALQLGVNAAAIMVRPHGAELAEIVKLVDAGALRPHVSHVLPLAQAADAHRLIESGHTRGKIVLEV